MTTTTITYNPGKWERVYGGRVNHLVTGSTPTDRVTGLSDTIYACGKHGWSQWGFDASKPYCPKCERVQREHDK